MPLVRSIVWHQWEVQYSHPKRVRAGPSLPRPVRNVFIIHPRQKKMLGENDVDIDFRIGHVLHFFLFLSVINQKCTINHVPSPPPCQSWNCYILIYIGRNTLFSPNLMIIITFTISITTHRLTIIWNNPISHRFISYEKPLANYLLEMDLTVSCELLLQLLRFLNAH